MILSCPSCATRYVLDPARLRPSGRTVRCARCAHTWHAEAPAVSLAESEARQPVITNPPPAAEESAAVRPSRRPSPAAEGAAKDTERRNLPALPGGRRLGAPFGWLGL